MKKNIILFFLSLFTFSLFAQSDKRIAKSNIPLNEVQQILMPLQNNKTLLEKEMKLRKSKSDRPERFGVPLEVNINPQSNGTWETLPNGKELWRIRISSKDAKSLNLGFTSYNMPKGGSLILYSADYNIVRGPFTPHDNEEHGQLWTPLMLSDEIVIEVQLEEGTKEELDLELSYVNHDFVGIVAIASGACNLDVICGEADGWGIVDGYRDIIRSVAFITVNGIDNCTGFLINNTERDCTPYFMTAAHCGIDTGDAPGVMTYWNFQNSYCRQPDSPESGQPGDGVLDIYNTGSMFRAGWGASDFTLLELDDEVNRDAVPFFPGWDIGEDVLPTSAICVHHPSNCEKRISFEDDPLYIGDWGSGADMVPDGDHLVVPDWDIGTTEGGSSGSPLFNQDKLVVGQLHGGGAACGNDNYDIYGWLAKSWEGGGTPQTRLKDWLDPNNSGVTSMSGKDCSFSIDLSDAFFNICAPTDVAVFDVTVSDNFTAPLNLMINNLPNGATATFANPSVQPGGVTTLTISDISNLSTGTYQILITGSDGMETGEAFLTLNVYEAVPTNPVLAAPTNLNMEVSTYPVYEWMMDIAVQTYEIEVATDMAFANVVDSANGLSTNTFGGAVLQADTDYYWRVRGENICGLGDWSATNQFKTAFIVCSIDESADVPVEIDNANPNIAIATVEIPFGGEIVDINIAKIRGPHTWLSDLTMTLISPSGTRVILVETECGAEENFDVGFDDQAMSNVLPCPYDDGNSYQPLQALSIFNGENPQGIWQLEIEDEFSQDGGSIEEFTLEICTSVASDFSVSLSTNTGEICAGDDFSFEVTIGAGFTGPVMLTSSINPTSNLAVFFTVDPFNLTAGQTVVATLNDLSNLNLGTNTITFNATDGTDSASSSPLVIEVFDTPMATTLGTPNDGITGVLVGEPQLFAWQTVSGIDNYTFELATDDQFSNIIVSENLNASTYMNNMMLDPETNYYWRVTTNNICGNTTSPVFSFLTQMIVGINQLPEQTFTIYPNPAKDQINIVFNQAIDNDFDLELYTIHGKRIYQQSYSSTQNAITLDLSKYNSGIYMLKLLGEKGILTKRIIVQK